MSIMPGDREAAGAAAGMAEVYGRPKLVWFSEKLEDAPNNRGVIEDQNGDRIAIRDECGLLWCITRDHLAPF